MRTESNIFSSSTYQAFKAIDPGEFKEKIRFCQEHRREINNLPLEEYIRVVDSYAEALFETGRYTRHIEIADEIILLSIEHNITDLDGRDIYFDTLFQKAASYYNLFDTQRAIHILNELIRMKPENESARLFLVNCHVREGVHRIAPIRKWSVVAILAAAGLIAIELIFIRPFVPDFTPYIETTRNTFFLSGATLLIGGELFVRYRAVRRMLTARNAKN